MDFPAPPSSFGFRSSGVWGWPFQSEPPGGLGSNSAGSRSSCMSSVLSRDTGAAASLMPSLYPATNSFIADMYATPRVW
eukprot:CAMPEP_0198685326 /NCGR_PEP_ID=MMETSP1468-20131203/13501_1 /TAXON_ID=1461545 /ORGANISM="Mantoniella sp, Strain CCMP1436" /LENGTH=78 /DNA_ID=CAMNT_0044430743 /DNA_START=271 /DNA_END=507 /DNA_ORIENTATION=-